MKKRICIWMNIPSHHQHFFFEALNQHPDVELRVVYYDLDFLEIRRRQGWLPPELESYSMVGSVDKILDPEFRGFIHVIPALDSRGGSSLAEKASKNNLTWVYWGEHAGLHFAEILHYNFFLYRLLSPMICRIHFRHQIYYVKKYAAAVFAQSFIAVTQLKQFGIEERKIHLLSYSIPALPHEPRSALIDSFRKGRLVFLCVAALREGKGIIWLLRAYAGLTEQERKCCCLAFVGLGDTSVYIDFCKKNGITDSVLFSGACKSDEISGFYNSCDCFVLPTLRDGWAVVLNEAASAGMPLISTTECGAAWHLIQPGENGFRVPPKNAEKLREAMRYYIEDPRRIKEHGKISLKKFSEFIPQRMASRLVNGLEGIMPAT